MCMSLRFLKYSFKALVQPSFILVSLGKDLKNILICVLKMNEGLTGVERHEGEELMTELSFLDELTL